MKYGQDVSLDISFNRLLSKHELINDSYKTHSRHKHANYGMNKNIKSEAEKKSTYSQISGGGLNKFDAYMKDYKYRYSKKKGIAKLDCYYEKKVLKKINNIYEISEYMRNKNKFYNKKIFNRYIISLIIFAFIPFLGTILPLFFSDLNPYVKNWCFNTCRSKHIKNDNSKSQTIEAAKTDHQQQQRYLTSLSKDTLGTIQILNFVLLLLSIIIVLFVLFYILLKYIKYARLRAGKGKMSLKQYCCFFNELITGK
ncbi:hypothetical protein PVIIG_05463 [Plasmodium vivax India VII]|uniref:Variable surface protein n=1 Tax=Plasmodium vivax India VII TaxID=1077284 RepID=A0A0J9S1H5_PLAVI|nr:hypothetical protein PVIIG_05463 [Plasmodium vivax India VII]